MPSPRGGMSSTLRHEVALHERMGCVTSGYLL